MSFASMQGRSMYIGSTIGEGALRFSDGTVQQTAYPGASDLGNITCDTLTVNETETIGSGSSNDTVLTVYGTVQQSLTGAYCTQFGSNALTSNTVGNNTAFGYGSLQNNTTGYRNASFGDYSLNENTTGYDNTAVGHSSQQLTTGTNNTSIGSSSLAINTTGSGNTAIGYNTLPSNTSGLFNTAIGCNADSANYSYSSTLGYNATNTANNQVMLGTSAETVTIPGALIIDGLVSQVLPSSVHTTQFGYNSLTLNTTGDHNTAFGAACMANNTTGNYNTGTGDFSLTYNETGNYNTAMGHYSNIYGLGGYNTSIGSFALQSGGTGTGSYNTGVGYGSLISIDSGLYNTALGYNSNQSTSTATNTTALGSEANCNNCTESTAIGYNATNTSNNQVMLGTSAETVQVPGTLTVEGNSTIGSISSTTSTFNAVPNFVNGFRCAGANAYSLFMGTATYSSGGYNGSTSIPPYIGSTYGDGNAYYNLDQTITGIVGCFINSQDTNFTMWYVSNPSTTQVYLSYVNLTTDYQTLPNQVVYMAFCAN